MNTNNTYLAVFLGSKTSPRRVAWDALSEGDRRAKEREGMAAWKAWVEKHHAAIVTMGGPLGKTKKVTQRGIDDSRLCARIRTRPPPNYSISIRIFPFSRAILSRSCPCCPFQALRGGSVRGVTGNLEPARAHCITEL
jgi:hypothetical protein